MSHTARTAAPAFDPADFPVRARGNKFEDFTEGQVFSHHWGRTITESDALNFATITCAYNPMYLNAEYSKAHGNDDLVVSPMLVLCTVVGLSVEDLSEAGGPFLGVEDCTFEAHVYPGDTLTASSTVLSARESSSRPTTGIVTWGTEARNQRDELVLSYTRTNLVAKRVKP